MPGPTVATNAAVGDPEVRALVYVDAFIPDQGETIAGLAAAKPGSCLSSPAGDFNAVPYPGARITSVNTGGLSLIAAPSVVSRVILQAVHATRITGGS